MTVFHCVKNNFLLSNPKLVFFTEFNLHIQDPPDTVFRENVQGGVPGVPNHPTSVLTPGVRVLLAELGLVVPPATCQLPESGATLIMCLSLDKSLAYRIFKNSSLCL